MTGRTHHHGDGDRGTGFRADGRAQAIQVGAVLLLAAIVISLASYQAFVVPQENREVEFDHSKQVTDRLSELRSDLLATGLDGSNRATTVQLGVRYPDRLLAINPGPAVGSLRTVGTTDGAINVSVLNATTGGETGDFWNGTTHNLTTGALVYEPGYNRYRSAPRVVYENSVLYASRDRGNATLSGQRLIRDDRITLVTLNGSLGASRTDSLTVDHQPASAAVRTVGVTAADASSNVTVTVPTLLSVDRWEDLLAAERVGAGGHVTDVAVESVPNRRFDRLRLELATGEGYDLRLARVGVGSGVENPGPAYLTNVSARPTAFEGETARVVFEVRDRFDNPVSGVRVRAATDRSDSALQSARATSDADGRVAFTYEAPDDLSSGGTDSVDVSFAVDPAGGSVDATTPQNASVPVTLRTVGGESVPYQVEWQDPSGQSGVDQPCSNETCVIDATESRSVTLTMATDPSLDGAGIGYAVNDTTVGSVQRATGVTDTNGENQTVVDVQRSGALRVYTWSGAAGDAIALNVTGIASYVRDDFESATLANNPNWSDGGGGDTAVVSDGSGRGDISASGSQAVVIENTDQDNTLVSRPLDTSGFSQVYAEYSVKQGDDAEVPDGGQTPPEDLLVEYLRSDGQWIEIDRFVATGSDGTYVSRSDTNTSSGYLHSGFRVRFRQPGASARDPWYVDDVCVAETQSTCDGASPGAPGFSSSDATSILPYANEQVQLVSFTPDTDLPSGESVTIDLSAAQQSTPRQVEYGSGGASVSQGGGSAGFNAQGSNSATVDYTPPSGGLSQGQTAVVRIISIRAGTPSNQNGPYTVSITRSDGNSIASTFDVAFDTGTSELGSVGATNLGTGSSGTTQTLSFTPSTALSGGESVTIDLSDPQDASGNNNNQKQVDYQNGSPTVTGGGGSVQFTQQGTYNATLRYTAPAGGVSAGSTVSVDVDGIITGTGNSGRGTYTVGFSREDADTRSVTFDVN